MKFKLYICSTYNNLIYLLEKMAGHIPDVFNPDDLPPPEPPRLTRTSGFPARMRRRPLTIGECNTAIDAFWSGISYILPSHGYDGDMFVRQANPEQLELAMVEVRKLQERFETDSLDELIELARRLGTDFINGMIQ